MKKQTSKPNLKVALSVDMPLFRHLLNESLSNSDGIRVVFESGFGTEFLDGIKDKKPDVVILDVRNEMMDGLDAIGEIHALVPDGKIMVLSGNFEMFTIIKMFKAGACGICDGKMKPSEFKLSLDIIMNAGFYFSKSFPGEMYNHLSSLDKMDVIMEDEIHLLEEEIHIIEWLCDGFDTKNKLGAKLFTSPKTAGRRLEALMIKIKAGNFADAIKFAVRNGITSLKR